MAKGDFQKGVSALMRQRGLTRPAAQSAYRNGERANDRLIPAEGQPAIAGAVSLADTVKLCEAFTASAKVAGMDPQEVLDFVEKNRSKGK